jgi:tetratricopeptide (TPR) repeat protein
MRFIAKCLPEEAEIWLKKAVAQAPGRREPFVDLAKIYYERADWRNCLWASEESIAIQDKPLEYLCEAEAWGYAPYDYAAIAAYNLNDYAKSVGYARKAVELNPADDRLQKNLVFCELAASEKTS